MFQSVRLTVAPDSAHVAPGSQLILSLTVQNASSIVDRYSLEVRGVAADWYDLSASSVSLFPAASQTVQLTLHPPAGSGTAAGQYPITIQATSEDDPKIKATATVTLVVTEVGRVTMELRPVTAEGRRAMFRLTFLNQGNAPTTLRVLARDSEDKLNFKMESEDAIVVPAGGQSAVSVLVTPQVRETIGEPHPYEIEFQGRRSDQDASEAPDPLLTRQARFTYLPRFTALSIPMWMRRLPGWLLLAALLLLLLLVFFAGNRAATALTPSPTTVPNTALTTRVAQVVASPTSDLAAISTADIPTAAILPTLAQDTPLPSSTPRPSATPRATVTPRPSPTPPLPKINHFGVQVGQHGSPAITWTVANASDVRLNGQKVSPAGVQSFHPKRTETIILSATNGSGTVSQVLRVGPPPVKPVAVTSKPVVLHAPVIQQFTAHPDARTGKLVLQWRVLNATSATINKVTVPVSGSEAVDVNGPTTYLLEASNVLGAASANLILSAPSGGTVTRVTLHPPSIDRFTLVHQAPGQPYTLVWQTSGTTTLTLDGKPVGASGSVPLPAPLQNHTYILVAKNDDGQTQAQVQLQVQ